MRRRTASSSSTALRPAAAAPGSRKRPEAAGRLEYQVEALAKGNTVGDTCSRNHVSLRVLPPSVW